MGNRRTNLDWIFANGAQVIEDDYSTTTRTLATAMGCRELNYVNDDHDLVFSLSLCVMEACRPYLLAGDRQGFDDMCKRIQVIKTQATDLTKAWVAALETGMDGR